MRVFSLAATRAKRLVSSLCVISMFDWLVGWLVVATYEISKISSDFNNSKTKMCFRGFWAKYSLFQKHFWNKNFVQTFLNQNVFWTGDSEQMTYFCSKFFFNKNKTNLQISKFIDFDNIYLDMFQEILCNLGSPPQFIYLPNSVPLFLSTYAYLNSHQAGYLHIYLYSFS